MDRQAEGLPPPLPALESLEERVLLSRSPVAVPFSDDSADAPGSLPGESSDPVGVGVQPSTAAPAVQSSDPPLVDMMMSEAPIGVARGIFPGRVVWGWDPAATKWSGSTTNGTYWWDSNGADQGRVDALVSESIRALTGQATDAAAWDALFRFFNKSKGRMDPLNPTLGAPYAAGQKIAIKINQNTARSGYALNGNASNQFSINGDPQLIKAVLRGLVNQAGVPQANITIYDSIRYIADSIYVPNHAEFPGVHFVDQSGTQGRELSTWTATNVITYAGPGGGQKVPQVVFDATYLIDMAIMKDHGNDDPTLCAKNWFGSINGINHDTIYSSGSMGTYANLVDLMGSEQLGGKTFLFMIDALYGAPGPDSTPVKWNTAPFNGWWPSSILVSQDGVAIDSVGYDFMAPEFTMTTLSNNYLHEAALANAPPSGVNYHTNGATLPSLGTHEHWNNTTDRQYSRNLGTGNGIELLAVKPGDAAPSAPTDLQLAVVSSSQVNLTWTDTSNVETGYKIERATNSGFTANLVLLGQASASATSYSDATAAPQTTYYYRVRAVNGSKESANAAAGPATTPAETLPAAPSYLAAVATSATQVNLTWTCCGTNDRGIKIERATDAAFTQNLALLTTTAAHATSYTDAGASSGTAYYYRVRATNLAGDSGHSNTAHAATASYALTAGLVAEFYNWGSTPSTADTDLSSYTPVLSRLDSQISYTYAGTPSAWGAGVQTTNFFLRETGYINFTQTGTYTFYLDSDDGAILWIGDTPATQAQVVNNDGGHGYPSEKTGIYTVTATGYKSFRLQYMQQAGGAGLLLKYSGPGITGTVTVPTSALFHGTMTDAYPNWIATSTNHWETAANWSGSTLPGASIEAVVNSSGTQVPTLYQNTSVLGLDIRAAGRTVNLNGYTLSLGAGGLQLYGGATPTDKIDTGSGNLIVGYTGASPLQMIAGWIKAGGGTKSNARDFDWNGTGGITSSSAAANKAHTALGVRDNGFTLINRFPMSEVDGVSVPTNSVVVRYTWYGDMDLDGEVTVNDYLEFLHYYAQNPPPENISWMTGDFNYDGQINVNDYLLLLDGYASQTGPLGGTVETMSSLSQPTAPAETTPTVVQQVAQAGGTHLATTDEAAQTQDDAATADMAVIQPSGQDAAMPPVLKVSPSANKPGPFDA
jgi:hypothetical protein